MALPPEMNPFPSIPFEIEQLVFEDAAAADPKAAFMLSFVSKQVQQW